MAVNVVLTHTHTHTPLLHVFEKNCYHRTMYMHILCSGHIQQIFCPLPASVKLECKYLARINIHIHTFIYSIFSLASHLLHSCPVCLRFPLPPFNPSVLPSFFHLFTCRPSQHVLERTSCLVSPTQVEVQYM